MTVPADAVHRERLVAQLLAGSPARTVEEVVDRLHAVQAQDPRAFRLAIRARTTGLTARDVDAALAARSCVVAWLNRGTLHLVRAEDYWDLHALTTPQMQTGILRRLAQEGVSPEATERGVAAIVGLLERDGTATRARIREELARHDVPTAGQATVHVLARAAVTRHVVRGPVVTGGEQAFVLAHDWIGPAPRVDREAALARLAHRYLAGHGPAGARDLAKWAGLPLREARRALGSLRSVHVWDVATTRRGASTAGAPDDALLSLATSPRASPGAQQSAPALPPPRLMGGYEPVLLGWESREDVVGAHRDLVTVNGLFRAFAMVAGRAVGTWRLEGGTCTIRPLEPIPDDDQAALQADAVAVGRFLGS